MIYIVNYFELLSYYCIYISVYILCFYKLVQAQTEIFTSNPDFLFSLQNLVPGWAILERKKDISDIEWSCYKYFIQTSWFYLIFQFLVSETIRNFNSAVVKYWYIVSSIIFVLLYMGIKQLIFILIQPFIFFILIFCGGKQISIWITSLTLLLCYNSLTYKYYFWGVLDDGSSKHEKTILQVIAMAWCELRCISFCLDYVDRKENIKPEHKSRRENMFPILTNLLSYVLYLPLLYLGPVMLYENFDNSLKYKNKKLWPRMKRFALDMALYQIYTLLLEFTMHYVYFCAMRADMKILKQLPSFALAGGGLWMGFLFYVKYVILYGTSSAFARLDCMEPPPTPTCIARIRVYSQMWKYFDVGLYKFLVRYIYRPGYSRLSMSTNLPKIIIKLIASFNTFAFACLWHNAASHVIIWSALSYCGIVIEYAAKAFSMTTWYKNFTANVLKTKAMEARFISVICAPFLVVSVASNFYFFGGTEVGHMYFGLLEWPAPHNVLILLLTAYCCSLISMSLRDVSSRTYG